MGFTEIIMNRLPLSAREVHRQLNEWGQSHNGREQDQDTLYCDFISTEKVPIVRILVHWDTHNRTLFSCMTKGKRVILREVMEAD